MKRHLSILILSAFVILSFNSCKKQSFNFPFTVKVITESGQPVSNIYVQAGAPVPDAIPDFSGYTDENGLVTFTYEYEAVLQIIATRGINPPSFIGCGFVKLEADKNVEITIVLQPYDPSQQGC